MCFCDFDFIQLIMVFSCLIMQPLFLLLDICIIYMLLWRYMCSLSTSITKTQRVQYITYFWKMSKPCFHVFRQNEQALMLKSYSYDHIVIMTNNFKERLEFEQSLVFVTLMLYTCTVCWILCSRLYSGFNV